MNVPIHFDAALGAEFLRDTHTVAAQGSIDDTLGNIAMLTRSLPRPAQNT